MKTQGGWPPTPHCTSWLKGHETEISTAGLDLKGLVPSYLLTLTLIYLLALTKKTKFYFFLKNQFVVDEVSAIIKEAIESTIGGNSYQHGKVSTWSTTIMDTILASLVKLHKPFKYVGRCYMYIAMYILSL